MKLLPSQELKLKQSLVDRKLPVGDFVFRHDPGGYDEEEEPAFNEIELRGTKYFFRITDRAFWFSPGVKDQLVTTAHSIDWTAIYISFAMWAGRAVGEVDAAERLKTFDARHFTPDAPQFAEVPETEPFTGDERATVDADLIAFAAGVGQRFDAMREQVGHVEAKLAALQAQQDRILAAVEYMRRSSDRLGKKDWSAAAVGTLMSILASTVLPQEVTRQIWLDFVAQLSHLKLLAPP